MNHPLAASLALALVLSCSAAAMADEQLLNVNSATQEQLAQVPGLNEELAAAIIKHRDEVGDFLTIDELTEVPGITKEILGKARQKLGVEGLAGASCNC